MHEKYSIVMYFKHLTQDIFVTLEKQSIDIFSNNPSKKCEYTVFNDIKIALPENMLNILNKIKNSSTKNEDEGVFLNLIDKMKMYVAK